LNDECGRSGHDVHYQIGLATFESTSIPWLANIRGMLELEEARRRLFDAIQPLPPETVPLSQAAGRVVADAVLSPIDLPAFDNSAMDGYAVRSADLASASAQSPVSLKLGGHVPAGAVSTGVLQPGTCVRVFTGSPLPNGADAVVMQEDSRSDVDQSGAVLILDRAKPWENVRFRGEDIKAGTTLVRTGEAITPGRLGLIAAAGIDSVSVHRRPVVGVLATGSELVEAGQPLAPGKIYESNRRALEPLLLGSGAIARVFPLVPDTLDATCQALRQGLDECDAVVTSGGVSVGELDFVKAALEKLGGTMDFWRVAIKPGKPFVFGRLGEKFLFGLPGNPVSAMVTFLLLVRPALRRLQGAIEVLPPITHGILAEALTNNGERRHFVRVRVDENGAVRSAGAQASHLLSSLAAANGLVEVPPNATLAAGSPVRVIRIED
jgi:molybdopterin molybdotransferase